MWSHWNKYHSTYLLILSRTAGNRIFGAEDIAGLEACQSLMALDLSRNSIVSVEALTQRLKLLPLKVFSLLGNPGVDSSG